MSVDLNSIIPPIVFMFDGAKVEILEVIDFSYPDGRKSYHVTVRVTWRDITTRKFFIDADNTDQFFKKLRIEINKLKFMYLAYGKEYVRGVVSS